MSGFYDDASWVLIPEGIKEDVVYAQKPTSGLGDLQFTRASDATRTNSAGVIERTPWNLLQQSEMFSQSPWNINRISAFGSGSIINDTIAPNGTLTADYIQQASGQTLTGGVFVQVSYILGQSYTLSVYAKKKENNYLRLGFAIGTGGLGLFGNFDLNTGVPGTPDVGVTQTIQDVGNGWYRCSITATSQVTTTANTFIYNSSTLNSSTTTPLQGIYIWGAQLVEGTDAKPYFATTNRQDVPRLDYRNADGSLNSCPRLLLEPQRTNTATKSDDFNGWSTKVNVTTTANYAVSPDGTQNADRLQFTVAGYLTSTPGYSQTSGTVYTLSCYAKRNGIGTESVGFFVNGSTIVNSAWTLTNEWQRLTYTYTASNTFLVGIAGANNADISVFGFQFEVGAYATTYIPTTTAAVTRLADLASKTGVSSLIGQTEGTIFLDFQNDAIDDQNYAFVISSNTQNRIMILKNSLNRLTCTVSTLNVSQTSITSSALTANTQYKCAIAYKKDDIAFYINGVQVGTDNLADIPAMTDIRFDSGAGSSAFFRPVNQSAIFPTRLTNAQLAQITTL
jgi:hypothetical protein